MLANDDYIKGQPTQYKHKKKNNKKKILIKSKLNIGTTKIFSRRPAGPTRNPEIIETINNQQNRRRNDRNNCSVKQDVISPLSQAFVIVHISSK